MSLLTVMYLLRAFCFLNSFFRLAEKGENLLAGLSYMFITVPALDLAHVLLVKKLAKANTLRTKMIVYASTFIGEHL